MCTYHPVVQLADELVAGPDEPDTQGREGNQDTLDA